MNKVLYIILISIFSLTVFSCSSDDEAATSSAVTVSGQVQKGPYVQGTEITVRELDSSMIPTGNTFTGTIDDNTGSFSIKGTLTNKIVELSAVGYYFNEVSGSLSSATLTLSALSDLTDISSVNVNLMTHLEKKRVEYLIDNSKMTFAAAKTQAQTEIMKIFNIDNVTLGNSETLDISKSGDGNAVLLAISAILQSDKTEAELTELLSTINTDIRTDGTLDSTTTKSTLVTAMEYIKPLRSTIRSNIESRYSGLGMSATIPSFEPYAIKLDTSAPTVSSVSPSDTTTSVLLNPSISVTFSELMDTTTLSTNTSDTICSGTVQVSADSFSTCVQMSSSTGTTSDNSSSYITTLTPSSNLSYETVYKIRISTGAKDLAGNGVANQYTTANGFTTITNLNVTQFGTSSSDSINSIYIDQSDNIYVTGGVSGSFSGNTSAGNYDSYVAKYNSSMSLQWVNQFGVSGTASNGEDEYGKDLVVDSSGNVYVTGNTTGNLNSVSAVGNIDTYVVKLNSSGSTVWTKIIGSSAYDRAGGITINSSGAIIVNGSAQGNINGVTQTSSCGEDLFVIKMDSSGNYTWTNLFGGCSGGGRVVTDSSDNIYISSMSRSLGTGLGSNDIAVKKIYDNGTLSWVSHTGTASTDQSAHIEIYNNSNLYYSGFVCNSDEGFSCQNTRLVLGKYSSSGSKTFEKKHSSCNYSYGLTIDSSENIYVSGSTGCMISKYNSSGTEIWVKNITSSTTSSVDTAINSQGILYVIGTTSESLDGLSYSNRALFIWNVGNISSL